MTENEKIDAMDIALRVAGFNFTKQAIHLICDIYDEIKERGNKITIEDIAKTETAIQKRYEK